MYSNRPRQHCSEKGEKKSEFKSINRHLLKGQLSFICFSFFANILGRTISLWLWISVIVTGWKHLGGKAVKLTFAQIYSCCLISFYIILINSISVTINKVTKKLLFYIYIIGTIKDKLSNYVHLSVKLYMETAHHRAHSDLFNIRWLFHISEEILLWQKIKYDIYVLSPILCQQMKLPLLDRTVLGEEKKH